MWHVCTAQYNYVWVMSVLDHVPPSRLMLSEQNGGLVGSDGRVACHSLAGCARLLSHFESRIVCNVLLT